MLPIISIDNAIPSNNDITSNDEDNNSVALAGVAQWIEHGTANQRVAGSIPSQGTCLGCRPGPQQGVCKRQPHIDVSLPLFLLPFLSL